MADLDESHCQPQVCNQSGLTVPSLNDVKKPANESGGQSERRFWMIFTRSTRPCVGSLALNRPGCIFLRIAFIVERTAWFIEPKVFATRTAAEFFPRDLLNSRLNLAFTISSRR